MRKSGCKVSRQTKFILLQSRKKTSDKRAEGGTAVFTDACMLLLIEFQNRWKARGNGANVSSVPSVLSEQKWNTTVFF